MGFSRCTPLLILLAVLSAPVLAQGGQDIFFAQYGHGSGLSSTLFLINPSTFQPAALDVEIRAGDDEGVSATVAPKGLRRVTTSTDGELVTGSVRVTSQQPLAGTILFGGANGLAGVPAVQPLSDFLAPVEISPDGVSVRTGLAVANPGQDPLSIQLTLLDSQGRALDGGEALIELDGEEQQPRFVDEIYADSGIDLDGFRGVLRAESSSPAAAMVLRTSPGEFATFPVSPAGFVDGEAPEAWKAAFPQVAVGPGITSTLVLINRSLDSAAEVSVRLRFPQDAQQVEASLPNVISVPQAAEMTHAAAATRHQRSLSASSTAGDLELTIQPLGLGFVELPAGQQLKVGWAEIDAPHPLGAAILFSGDFGTAAVPAVSSLNTFLSPVETDAEAGITTGLAIANPSDGPVDAVLRLRSPSGGQSEGPLTLTLQAGQQLARQSSELFPSTDFARFLGLIEVSSPVALPAAAIRQSPGQFATLPVSPSQETVYDLIVSSRNSNSVKRFDGSSGEFLDDFVSPGEEGLNATQCVRVGPDGFLYVSGRGNPSVFRFHPASMEFEGPFTSGYQLDNPTKITFGPDGHLYVSQWGQSKSSVARFDGQSGQFMDEMTPNLNQPGGHAWDSQGRLYVVSFGSRDVRRFDSQGQLDEIVVPAGTLQGPINIWFGRDRDLYAIDWQTGSVIRFDGETFESKGVFISGMTRAEGYTFGPAGDLYICDWQRNEINRYNPETGQLISTFATGGDMRQPNSLVFLPRPEED
ncbi:MAG TPA: NHL repeat-containing protein [Acidobacteriota bacterium]|nr:NHL repeat-containing protein [Acidobacteriota bacterium]